MNHFFQSLIAMIASLHIYFFILETFYWTKPLGLKTFRMTQDEANSSALLAANQGLYNLFLAMGLLSSLFFKDTEVTESFQIFFLGCIGLAGLYGYLSLGNPKGKKILMIQFSPAALAFIIKNFFL